jgi:hypothetical protein
LTRKARLIDPINRKLQSLREEKLPMAEPHEEQSDARRFLLGYLDEEERAQMEKRLTSESDYLEMVLETESELMEDYVAGQLSEDNAIRFRKYVLTSQQQVEQLNLTRALGASARVHAAANSPPIAARTKPARSPRPWSLDLLWVTIWEVKFAAAIILVVLCGTASYFAWRYHASNTNNPLQNLTAEFTKLNTQQSLDAEATNKGFIIGPLKGGLVRDEQGVNSFSIPETEKIVQLRLQIGAGDYQSFQASLQTAEGREILPLNDLKPRSIKGEKLLIIYLPAQVLTPGDYQLRLSGVTQDHQSVYLGRYTFRIVGE